MDKSVSWPIILIYYFSSTLAFMWTLVQKTTEGQENDWLNIDHPRFFMYDHAKV
jgi:hypothetical protein